MECAHRPSTLFYCAASAGRLCALQAHSEAESTTALQHGADELRSLSHSPSTALRLSLRLPPPGERNFLAARAYLPSARYWCDLRRAAPRLRLLQSVLRARVHHTLCCDGEYERSELRELFASPKGGVAKMLIYASESAVRLALSGKRQLADEATPFLFAHHSPGCASSSFTCYFLPSLCNESAPAPRRRRRPELAMDRELSWPSALRRTAHIAIALERRVNSLQPGSEAQVRGLLLRCVRMDPAGRVFRGAARHTAARAPWRQAIGMHVRRGDACETFARREVGKVTDLDAERRCYPLDEYLHAAADLRRLYGMSLVLLITDSPTVITQLRHHPAARGFTWQWLEFDRWRVAGGEAANLHKPPSQRVFIEDRAARGEAENAVRVASALADLRFVSEADVVVGTSRSFVTQAAQLLILARGGVLPPVISLEGDPLHSLLHVRGRFWRSEDRGWIPCAYARPYMDDACFSCLNLTVGGANASCMDRTFLSRALQTQDNKCVDRWRRSCDELPRTVVE
ncbi:hypothetical protein AB1Y20_006895 [Prymnesium parvum]|uniref:Uncharacterized protein n=1 Tax=Prymnesium parvum TaxID=97485 RepID=A0AB34IZR0_PRYPA